jgi:hypothetical protein
MIPFRSNASIDINLFVKVAEVISFFNEDYIHKEKLCI